MASRRHLRPQDSETWLDAMRAKHDVRGKLAQPLSGMRRAPIAAVRQWLMPSQAVTDMPAYCFSSELIEAYPEAKVILTLQERSEREEGAAARRRTRTMNGK
jgi:hypothetical protein